MSRRAGAAAAMLIAAAAAAAVWGHTKNDSLSTDEPIHMLSGYTAVASGSMIANLEHPPLLKSLAGLSLLTLPLKPPPSHVPIGAFFSQFGQSFIFDNASPPDAITARARLPFLLVFVALLLLVFFEARRRYGTAPALFAEGLLAFDPNLVAHAGVVHTDLGSSLGFLATVLAWDAATRAPSGRRTILAGVCLGASLASKFSAVYLVPILLIQTLLAARREAGPGQALGRGLLRLVAAGAVAAVLLFAIYAVATRSIDVADEKAVISEMIAMKGAPRLGAALARLVDVSPPLAAYAGGLASVARQNAVGGGVNYMFGKLSTDGFPMYFFVAFALKSTLAFLAAAAVVIGAAALPAGRDDGRGGHRMSFERERRVDLVPIAVLLLASVGSSYNIGIRHILPVYPFLALFAAAVFARVWARRGESAGRRALALAMAAMPVAAAVELVRIHPNELSYFNALAGGPEHGRFLLNDSNVDWGLDLKRLAAELKRRRIEDPTVAYFGADTVRFRVGVDDYSVDPTVRRFVAISGFFLAAGPEFFAYHHAPVIARNLAALRREIDARGKPAGRVGYSIYLYEMTP
ncbi:MAG TPA: glycosyltransferase family 39 protein [Thermoanaerobaculia bacterium]|nr:glycosyltransferase family 39 protein [Thermoanaerobaculia bacterium]